MVIKRIMYSENYKKGVFLNIISKDKKDWKRQIDFINSLSKVNHLEIWIEEDLKLSELKFLKSLLKNYEILIHGPFVHLSLVSPHPEIEEITIKKYLQTLKIAEILGGKVVTFHGGPIFKFGSKKDVIKTFIQNFRKIKNLSKEKISFTIENLPSEKKGVEKPYPASLQDFIYLKNLFPWLHFTLDMGHALQNGESLDKISKFLKKYKNSILDIHLHDAIFKKEAHLPLGKGELNLVKFLKLLQEINYQKYLTLETLTPNDTKFSWQKLLSIEKR